MKIRLFEIKDIEEVYNLGIKVKEFSDGMGNCFWNKETLKNFSDQGLSFVVTDDKIVGFLLAEYRPVTRKLAWENMYLEREYRRQGLAEECFERSFKIAKEYGAILCEGNMCSDNFSSRNLLERLGFHSAGKYDWMLKFVD